MIERFCLAGAGVRPTVVLDWIVEISPPRKKDWVLTQSAFDKLLAQFDSERGRAGEKYEELRLRLMKFFEWRNCSNSEEHADETFNRVARKIDEGEEVRNITAYAYEVARYLVLETWRQPEIEQEPETGFSDLPTSASPPASDPDVSDTRLDCLEKCMNGLPPEKRELIIDYYEGEKREKIAKRLGLTINALKIRACRIRTELERCINKCVEQTSV